VRPDYVVQVRQDVLNETDGPMLTHALQALHNEKMQVPASVAARPNPALLDERYARFIHAA
jgi:putative restriction endonuclease